MVAGIGLAAGLAFRNRVWRQIWPKLVTCGVLQGQETSVSYKLPSCLEFISVCQKVCRTIKSLAAVIKVRFLGRPACDFGQQSKGIPVSDLSRVPKRQICHTKELFAQSHSL